MYIEYAYSIYRIQKNKTNIPIVIERIYIVTSFGNSVIV